jgi:serine/threonine-protein kinase
MEHRPGDAGQDTDSIVPEVPAHVPGQGRMEWLAVLRAHQHRAWHRGQRLPAETYLQRLAALRADEELAVDLICSEVLLRRELGEAPAPAEYVARFPQYEAPLREQFALYRALPAHARPPGGMAVPGYEILEELGRGGMAVVYKARAPGFDRPLALKTLHAPGRVGPGRLARFRREAEALGRLWHPNVVRLWAVGEHDGRPFLALEYVEGGTLMQRLNGKPLPPRQAARLVAVLARAMHHVHQQGVVHRDLKPANVLLTADGTPKIADFGLARCLDGEAEPSSGGAVLGTPSYMAPEQANGDAAQVGPTTDIFGLGVVLYEVLTGMPPYQGTDPLAVWQLARKGEVIPPRRLNRRVPRALEHICLTALAVDPGRRYGSALELERVLESYLRRWSLGTVLGLLGALAAGVWNWSASGTGCQ